MFLVTRLQRQIRISENDVSVKYSGSSKRQELVTHKLVNHKEIKHRRAIVKCNASLMLESRYGKVISTQPFEALIIYNKDTIL